MSEQSDLDAEFAAIAGQLAAEMDAAGDQERLFTVVDGGVAINFDITVVLALAWVTVAGLAAGSAPIDLDPATPSPAGALDSASAALVGDSASDVERTITARRWDFEQASAWMTVLNQARLAVMRAKATSDDFSSAGNDDPMFQMMTAVLDELCRALY